MSSPTATTINLTTFQYTLARYEKTLTAISTVKYAKPDQKSLQELDEWKDTLHDVITKRKTDDDIAYLTKEEVEGLVRWKLKRGKNRPTLPSLVASNSAALVKTTTAEAFALPTARDEASLKALLSTLTTPLRGIGPATATAILAAAYPDSVPFFSDEGYRWVVCDGDWKHKIDYNVKEYVAYWKAVNELTERLGATAEQVERAGWVLGQEAALGIDAGYEPKPEKKAVTGDEKREKASTKDPKPEKVITKKGTKDDVKHKDDEVEPDVRRSKRNKTAK